MLTNYTLKKNNEMATFISHIKITITHLYGQVIMDLKDPDYKHCTLHIQKKRNGLNHYTLT